MRIYYDTIPQQNISQSTAYQYNTYITNLINIQGLQYWKYLALLALKLLNLLWLLFFPDTFLPLELIIPLIFDAGNFSSKFSSQRTVNLSICTNELGDVKVQNKPPLNVVLLH